MTNVELIQNDGNTIKFPKNQEYTDAGTTPLESGDTFQYTSPNEVPAVDTKYYYDKTIGTWTGEIDSVGPIPLFIYASWDVSSIFEPEKDIIVNNSPPTGGSGTYDPVTYKWYLDGTEVAGEITNTLTLPIDSATKEVYAEVTAVDSDGATATSQTTKIIVIDVAIPVKIDTVTLSENDTDVDNNPRYTNQTFDVNVNCDITSTDPIEYYLKAKSEGSLLTQAQTSVITGVDDSGADVILELTDPTGLDEFTPGEDIVQNGGGTPVSSAITNVAIFDSQGISGADFGTADNDLTSYLQGLGVTHITGFRLSGVKDAVYGAALYKTSVLNGSDIDALGIVPLTENGSVTGMDPNATWTNMFNGSSEYAQGNPKYYECTFAPIALTTLVVKTSCYTDRTSYGLGICDQTGRWINAVGNTAVEPSTVLTLTDDTNLANFRVGDVVQRAPIASPVFHTVCIPDTAPSVNAVYTIFDTAALDMTSTAVQSVPNNVNPVPAGYAYKQLMFDLLTESGDFNVNADTTGWFVLSSVDGFTWVAEGTHNPDGSSVRSLMSNQPNARYLIIGSASASNDWNGVDNFRVQFNQDLINTWANGEYTPTQLPASYDIHITAINEAAPSITTDGGSWSGTDGTGDEAWNKSEIWSNQVTATTGTISASNPITNVFDGDFSTFSVFDTAVGVFGISPGIGKPGDIVTYYGTNGGGTITINGITVTGVGGGVIANPGNPIVLSAPITEVGIDSNCSWGGLAINGVLFVDKGISGGADASVTGPAFAAAEGKVSSVDAAATPPTLTVSGSSSRWLATKLNYQEDLKFNKVVQSKDFVEVDNVPLYAIFDGNGNIRDLQESDPGYVNMTSGNTVTEAFKLKFPSNFNVLIKSPDDILKPGSSLCVDVKATNNINDEDIMNKDTLSPGFDGCVTPIEISSEPNAVMSGLRFDSARSTYLENTLSPSNIYTISVWVKNASNPSPGYIFADSAGTTGFNIHNDQLQFWNGTTQQLLSNGVTNNQWRQVVITRDGDTITSYVNGVVGTPITGVSVATPLMLIGRRTSSGTPNDFNGYLSEYFYVEGQALPPETFGYDYENQGKWAPLDNAVIKQNIIDAKAAAFPDENLSQMWSKSAIGEYSGNPADAFNGVLSLDEGLNGVTTSANETIPVTWGVTNVPMSNSTVSITHSINTTQSNIVSISAGDKTDTSIDQGIGDVTTITGCTGDTITISAKYLTGAGSTCRINQIVVDGQILVDGGFGGNGFYLPFDPAAVGDAGQLLSNVAVRVGTPPADATALTYTSNGQLFSDVGVTFDAGSIQTFFVVKGSGDPSLFTSNDGTTWTTVMPGTAWPSSVMTVEARFAFLSSSGSNFGISGYNSIGVDDSGNGNNFHDQNLALTGVAYTNYNGGLNTPAGWSAVKDPEQLLVDNQNGFIVNQSGTRYFKIKTLSTTVSFKYISYDGNATFAPTVSLGESVSGPFVDPSGSTGTGGSADPNVDTYTVVSGQTYFVRTGSVGRDNSALVVYGTNIEMLPLDFVNPLDTVTDTPVKNYATLLTGSNGNLVATGDSSITYLGEVGTDYYYEEDGVGAVHTGGQTFSSTSGVTYNFGQQPFTIAGYDDSKVWSSDITVSSGSVNDVGNIFDGKVNTFGVGTENDSIITFTPDGGLSYTSGIKVWLRGGDHQMRLNGGAWVSSTGNPDSGAWTTLATGSGNIDRIEVQMTTNSKTAVNAIEVDSRILVDTGNPLTAAYANTLFQKWSEWNKVVTLLSNNPDDVIKFNQIKSAMLGFPSEKEAARATLRQTLIDTSVNVSTINYLLGE